MVTTTTTTTTTFLQPVDGTKLETINCLVFQFTARALLLAGLHEQALARQWVTILYIYEQAPDHQHSDQGRQICRQYLVHIGVDT